MKSAIIWPSAVVLGLASAIWMHENQVAAQLLPEPADEETAYGPELPSPAEPARQDMQTIPSGRARLGITLDPRFREAVVRSVTPGGAADHAGLEPGDTIEALNGNRVYSYRDVPDFIDAMRPGDIIDIDFSRRITGRTQAVLDGAPLEGPAAADVERGTFGREPVDQAAYEPLPGPPYSTGRMPQTAPRRDLAPRPLETYDDRAARRDELERRERSVERDRDEDYRRRPLLRWRRN
jgi:hypothetical protein